MKIEQVKITELKPAKYNPRQLSKSQFEALRESLDKFGFVDPIVANKKNNVIIGGHQRVKVWQDLGNEMVPVFWVDLDEAQERELNIRLNANTGDWDTDILANMFETEELEAWGFDMEILDIMDDGGEKKKAKGGEGDVTYKILIECETEEKRETTLDFLKKHKIKAEKA